MWKWGCEVEPKKLQLKLLACNATQNWTKIQPGRRLAPFTLYSNLSFNPATLRAKNGLKLAAGTERRIGLFPLCPLCVSASHSPAFPGTRAPNSTLQHCYITFRKLISWSKGWSNSKMHLFPAKWGTEPYTAPQNAKFPANFNGKDIKSSILHLKGV